MSEREEKKTKKRALFIAVGSHVALLILFFFLLAWKEPYPPKPEYGIELNFGMDQVGAGTVQPETPPATQQEEVEEVQEEITETEEVVAEEIIEESQPVEEVQEEIETQPLESPVKEEKKVEEPKPKPKKPVTEKPKETETAPKEVKKDNQQDQTSTAKDSNQGDNPNTTGDKGDSQGSLDSRALYGSQGGGDGASLDLAGWMWDFTPKPNDTSSESGRIVFQIKIDDQGEIISVRTLEKTVSPTVEKVYRQAVERLTFSKKADNAIPAPISTGTITFIIKSK